jgi:hypothetical protein
MEDRLIKLKSDFSNVITIRNTVKNVFDILQTRIDKLKIIYLEFIKDNKTEMFVFGLDSFYFQNKLIDIEYDDMMRLFLAINNRMYCEYFKLYKMIVEYVLKNVNDKKIIEIIKVNNFPVYKDLEPFKEYKFEIVLELHDNIINLLSSLNSYLINKEMELKVYKQKKDIGLNIDNFVNSFNFNNIIIKEKISLFITYIEFFHKLHSKYLKRFSNKIQLMYTHISNDINFDESVELNADKRNEIINEFIGNNINKEVLDELKNSIHADSTSSDSENSNLLSNIKNKTDLTSISTNNTNNTSKSKSIEKKVFKNIKKNMVSKAKNLCTLFSGSNPNESPKTYSDEDIKTAFSEINECCNLVINSESNKNLKEFIIEVPRNRQDSNVENSSITNSSISDNNENFNIDTESNNSNNNENIPLTIKNVILIPNIEPVNFEAKIAELNEHVQNELKEKFKENAINESENVETFEDTKLSELKELTDLKIVSNSQKKKHKKKKH